MERKLEKKLIGSNNNNKNSRSVKNRAYKQTILVLSVQKYFRKTEKKDTRQFVLYFKQVFDSSPFLLPLQKKHFSSLEICDTANRKE